MTPRQLRSSMLVLSMLTMGGAVAIALTLLQDDIVYYHIPSHIDTQAPPSDTIRIGGVIEKDSLQRHDNQLSFRITDYTATIPVTYQGVPPSLFREESGAIVEGTFRHDGVFHAQSILAKHDENYMPPAINATEPALTHSPSMPSPY
ncbi:MAG: cytochrome c maturation protein CcmE [Alphaproteobacteria bacterium GM7ARS4]|nr:cytochrome c maturation protein CcmE [Alphaproteobacteria bacterium GM7ARS4]